MRGQTEMVMVVAVVQKYVLQTLDLVHGMQIKELLKKRPMGSTGIQFIFDYPIKLQSQYFLFVA